MSRLIDADALKRELVVKSQSLSQRAYSLERGKFIGICSVITMLDEAPTVCCETCKHGIKGECIGDREYVSCVKPYAGMSNSHTKDWFCGDWKDKNAVN